MNYKRGEIWMCDLSDKSNGSEQHGKRWCVIVSNNIGNKYASVVTVAFITSRDKDRNKSKMQPTHTKIMLHKPSLVLTEQLQTVSKDRLYNYLRKTTDEEMKEIDKCLNISLGLEPNYK